MPYPVKVWRCFSVSKTPSRLKSVERPEPNKVEFPARGGSEQRFELHTVAALAAGDINELANDLPALSGRKFSKLSQLVEGVLLVCADSSIDSDPHTIGIPARQQIWLSNGRFCASERCAGKFFIRGASEGLFGRTFLVRPAFSFAAFFW
jgi:hypothetical protein